MNFKNLIFFCLLLSSTFISCKQENPETIKTAYRFGECFLFGNKIYNTGRIKGGGSRLYILKTPRNKLIFAHYKWGSSYKAMAKNRFHNVYYYSYGSVKRAKYDIKIQSSEKDDGPTKIVGKIGKYNINAEILNDFRDNPIQMESINDAFKKNRIKGVVYLGRNRYKYVFKAISNLFLHIRKYTPL